MNAADCLNGQRFRISEAAVGVNCPPMHPFCRCKVTTPQQTEEDIQADIDRMLEGTSIEEIEQRLDMMIEEREALPESDSTLKSVEENPQKMLTGDENGDIIGLSDIQTGDHIKTDMYDQDVVLYDITDERINSIEQLNLSSLDDETNKKLTDECKLLLDYVRNEKTGTEAAFVFDNNMGNKQEFKAPDDKGHVNFACSTDKSIVIHNHPDGLLFSEADLQRFEADEKLQILGAIGNNGSTYFVEKTDTYDHIGFYDFLGRSRGNFPIDWTNEEQLKYSESILKECGNYGINVYIRQN